MRSRAEGSELARSPLHCCVGSSAPQGSEWSDGRAPRGARPSVAKSVPIDGIVMVLRVGGIARRRDELEILGFHGALAHEFLDAPTTDRLPRVEIALRADGPPG